MLPPGSRAPAFWQTYRYITRPLEYSREVIARFGPTARARTLNGRGIVVASPEMVKLVFGADPDTFETVPLTADLFGPHAVIATSGAKHRRQRKLLNPRFHGPRVKAFLATMQRVTRDAFAALERARTTGEVVVMNELTQVLTLDVILETVFGETRGLDRAKSREILLALVRSLAPATFAMPMLRTELFPPWRRFARARRAFDAWTSALVAERRAAASPGSDILGLLVEARYDDGSAMDVDEIRDQLFTLLIAGHETTAVTIAWGVYHLLREPEALARLRAELDALGEDPSADAIVKVPYLEAVCSEALRIEPVVTDVARVCKKPLALGEYTVPVGELVFVNICAMLRDERAYPEPHRFRPERFLEKKYGPAEFMPFGGGQRRCLGAAFAEAELAIALATIAREWELSLASDEPEIAVRRNITMGPKSGVRVRVAGARPRR